MTRSGIYAKESRSRLTRSAVHGGAEDKYERAFVGSSYTMTVTVICGGGSRPTLPKGTSTGTWLSH